MDVTRGLLEKNALEIEESDGQCQQRRNLQDKKAESKTKDGDGQMRIFKRRWIMLLLFCLSSALNACHWIQYSSIANVVMRYYDVSAIYVNWSSMIYMAVYVPLVFPATWLLERKGLRIAMISGVLIMTLGSWMKLLSLDRDKFSVGFLAQFIIGSAQMFMLSVPARVAGLWFDSSQVSTACALGVSSNQLGIALSFLIPPIVVSDSEDYSQIRSDLQLLYIMMAVPTTLLLILVYFFFEAAPPVPPSLAQFSAREREKEKVTSYSIVLKKLITNKDYVLLMLSYGLNVGVFYAYSTLLNQLFLIHFPSGQTEAGQIGLTLIIGGMWGSVVWGIVLDKTHMYRGTTLLVYAMGVVGIIGFTYALSYKHLIMIYITSGFLGFFMNGYLTVAYEFAAELTYPLPESTSSGLLNAIGEALGVALVLGAGILLDERGDFPTNLLLSSVLIFGLLISFFISGKNLQRLAAGRVQS
ncbi:uncharacterized MFS-type transporter C09D4.1 isoform X2 [Halyomorpha halys]|uniref:uncharacterized MFS-type transporter C09D4.1 isoform X2 n=1 Tax=Halyomorpha halys TaxID=286706 RepID=UPI0006D4F7E3|nr:uncharacterized MFS-type transporter C09D4.1 isoform X2 [Halyomorpha halys]